MRRITARSAREQREAQYPTWPISSVRISLYMQFDAFGDFGFVGEQFEANAAQFVEHDAAGHFCRAHEEEAESFG